MKTILKNTGIIFVALMIYTSAGRLLFALWANEVSNFSSFVAMAIVTAFISLLIYFSATLFISEIKSK